MNINPIEAKIRKSADGPKILHIRAGDVVIRTELVELAACDFRVWASAPIAVEIPPEGTKNFGVGPFTGRVNQEFADGNYPHIIKFPVYKAQLPVSAEAYQETSSDGAIQVLTKMPLIAVATESSAQVDGKLVQTHCVLPIWSDGSAVLVTLECFEGEPAEGTNTEYHMRASEGLPAALGLQHLEQASRIATDASHRQYHIQLTPWLLGAQLLEDDGKETKHRIWQREWAFAGHEEFLSALGRITRGLMGPDPSGH